MTQEHYTTKNEKFQALDKRKKGTENWINNLPRKIFNYSISAEIFENVLFDIAI